MNIFLFVIVCFSHVMCTLHSICTVHSITYNEYDSCRSFYCKTVHFLIRQIKKKNALSKNTVLSFAIDCCGCVVLNPPDWFGCGCPVVAAVAGVVVVVGG